MESDRVKWDKYVQSDMPDTSGVNTTLVCAATQLLVLKHLVWTTPHIRVLYVGTLYHLCKHNIREN